MTPDLLTAIAKVEEHLANACEDGEVNKALALLPTIREEIARLSAAWQARTPEGESSWHPGLKVSSSGHAAGDVSTFGLPVHEKLQKVMDALQTCYYSEDMGHFFDEELVNEALALLLTIREEIARLSAPKPVASEEGEPDHPKKDCPWKCNAASQSCLCDPPVKTEQPVECRKAFEAGAMPGGYDFTQNECGDYVSIATNQRWYGFKEAWNHRSTMRESGDAEHLKHLLRRSIGLIERGQVSAVDHEAREVVLKEAYAAVAVDDEQGRRGSETVAATEKNT